MARFQQSAQMLAANDLALVSFMLRLHDSVAPGESSRDDSTGDTQIGSIAIGLHRRE
jgi:hypothetical protein